MKIKDLLKNKKSGERQKMKTDAHCSVKPFSYVMNGIEITIKSIKKESEGNMIGLLKIVAEATKNGQSIFVDNPLYYKNPPIMVPDGTKRIEVVNVPYIDKKEREVDNFKEDAKEAMKIMVYETIKTTNK